MPCSGTLVYFTHLQSRWRFGHFGLIYANGADALRFVDITMNPAGAHVQGCTFAHFRRGRTTENTPTSPPGWGYSGPIGPRCSPRSTSSRSTPRIPVARPWGWRSAGAISARSARASLVDFAAERAANTLGPRAKEMSCVEFVLRAYQLTFGEGTARFIDRDAEATMPWKLAYVLRRHPAFIEENPAGPAYVPAVVAGVVIAPCAGGTGGSRTLAGGTGGSRTRAGGTGSRMGCAGPGGSISGRRTDSVQLAPAARRSSPSSAGSSPARSFP